MQNLSYMYALVLYTIPITSLENLLMYSELYQHNGVVLKEVSHLIALTSNTLFNIYDICFINFPFYINNIINTESYNI